MSADTIIAYVVLPTHNGKAVGPPTTCHTMSAAQRAVEESREKDTFGFYADYATRPMTDSELADLLRAQ